MLVCHCNKIINKILFIVNNSQFEYTSTPTKHAAFVRDIMLSRLAALCLFSAVSDSLSARSSRPLRSADRCDLLVGTPWSRTSLSQNRAFAVVGPALWNDTPPALRSVMLQGISPASLRSLKTSFHLPVTLRAPLNNHTTF